MIDHDAQQRSTQPRPRRGRGFLLHKRKRYDIVSARITIQKHIQKIRFTSMKNILRQIQHRRVTYAAIAVMFAASGLGIQQVWADQYQEKIDALNQSNSQNIDNLAQLGAQADSYQDQINKLQAEINALQSQIQANQDKSTQLQQEIVQAEADLEQQREILGHSIKKMYVEGQISTIEMLASSKDLSEFVDKQQYRESVQNKIKTTVDAINELKIQLKAQRDEVEVLLKDLREMQSQLAGQQAEQNRLLSMNQAEQAVLDAQIKENKAKVADLRAQQAAAIAAAARSRDIQIVPSTGNGGYPDRWALAAPDSLLDSWGMYNRECVSYTAYKVWESGRYMPYWGGHGNANQWPGNARRMGIPVDSTPRVGSVAVLYIGVYGHVMYVEAVLEGGSKVLVSQYNWAPYAYNEMILSTAGMEFIHFP
ncbi:hypothetical protein CR970_03615 [Candidatus Saccharibacteria bacterium]|nr:MAG: hypothetical protein CR970_03615 [Candidatus Saccharibacteria bacterium]